MSTGDVTATPASTPVNSPPETSVPLNDVASPAPTQKLYRYYFKQSCVYCKYFEVHLDLHPALKQYVEFIDITHMSPLPEIRGVPTIVNLRDSRDSYLGPRCLWWLRGMIVKLAESLPIAMPPRPRLEQWFGVTAPARAETTEEYADSPFQSQDIDENQEESGAQPGAGTEVPPPTSFADLSESDGIRVLVAPDPEEDEISLEATESASPEMVVAADSPEAVEAHDASSPVVEAPDADSPEAAQGSDTADSPRPAEAPDAGSLQAAQLLDTALCDDVGLPVGGSPQTGETSGPPRSGGDNPIRLGWE